MDRSIGISKRALAQIPSRHERACFTALALMWHTSDRAAVRRDKHEPRQQISNQSTKGGRAVPSHYVLRVGEIDVLVISDGRGTNASSRVNGHQCRPRRPRGLAG